MDELAEFLTARLDEDESAARDVWTTQHNDPHQLFVRDQPDARALADVEAKRRIVRECRRAGFLRVLRLLAMPYADHPDYDERWRV